MSTPIEANTEELQNILETVNNLPNLGGGGFNIPVIDLAELGFENIIVGKSQSMPIDTTTYEQYGALMRTGIVQIKFSCTLDTKMHDYAIMATVNMQFITDAPEEMYDSFVYYEACGITSEFTLYFCITPYNEAYVYIISNSVM